MIAMAVGWAIDEDLGRGDVTTNSIVSPEERAAGHFLAKEALVLAGLPVAEAVLRFLEKDVLFESKSAEGGLVRAGDQFAFVRGRARTLLSGERVALNFLQRMSGIATLTRKAVDEIAGTSAKILDTRKTTPLLRSFEKYAVRMGGGFNHRTGLDDGVLIKENHIAMAGGIKPAVESARKNVHHLLRIEVEVTSLEELEEALENKADVILLDNMPVEHVWLAVKMAKGRAQLEVSGGVTLDKVRAYAETGVDFISLGALTHSFKSVDISFEIAET